MSKPVDALSHTFLRLYALFAGGSIHSPCYRDDFESTDATHLMGDSVHSGGYQSTVSSIELPQARNRKAENYRLFGTLEKSSTHQRVLKRDQTAPSHGSGCAFKFNSCRLLH